MIGLDTPVLVDVLRGREEGRKVLALAEGEELATTELNVLELEILARSDHSPGRERRLAALERLRQRITVLPVDSAAVRIAGMHAARRSSRVSLHVAVMLGAAEAGGCGRWVADRGSALRWPGRMKVNEIG